MLILGRAVGQRTFVGLWMVVTLDEIKRDSVVVSVDDHVRDIHKQFRVHMYNQPGVRIDHDVVLFNTPSPNKHTARLGFAAPKAIGIVREELRVRDELRVQKRRRAA